MLRNARQATGVGSRTLFGLVLPVAVGVGLSYLAQPLGTVVNEAKLEPVVRSVLTVAGILCGFLIALMIFTGKAENTQSLSLEQMRDYVGKAKYLLFAQTLTLFNHLVVVLFCLAWQFAPESASEPILRLLFGFLVLSFLRTAILPFQIFELHEAGLDGLIEQKRIEGNKRAKEIADSARR